MGRASSLWGSRGIMDRESDLPTASGGCVCSLLTAVCVHLDGLNAEHKFQVWVTILSHMSRPFLNKRSLAPMYCIQAFGKSVKCFGSSVVNYVSRVLKNDMKFLLLVQKLL